MWWERWLMRKVQMWDGFPGFFAPRQVVNHILCFQMDRVRRAGKETWWSGGAVLSSIYILKPSCVFTFGSVFIQTTVLLTEENPHEFMNAHLQRREYRHQSKILTGANTHYTTWTLDVFRSQCVQLDSPVCTKLDSSMLNSCFLFLSGELLYVLGWHLWFYNHLMMKMLSCSGISA